MTLTFGAISDRIFVHTVHLNRCGGVAQLHENFKLGIQIQLAGNRVSQAKIHPNFLTRYELRCPICFADCRAKRR